MTVYLDTSFIVALLVEDLHSERATSFLQDQDPEIIVSDFAAAEFAAAVARHVRMGKATFQAAAAVLKDFDAWAQLFSKGAQTHTLDVRTAETFIRRLDLNLRAPDAIHIAIARRMDATLATFDQRMAASAVVLGLALAPV